ncbi:MAG: DUF2752 domain-containing protein, partial [Deltaproteobacteria bacterium]|nr:DUF2752 domain-containing protein [Deltaproteobacteria bacterium]
KISQRGILVSVISLVVVFVASFLLSIDSVQRIPLCFFHSMTHLDCPGCGLVRSFISLAHGQFIQSIRYNAMGPVLFFVFALYLIQLLSKLFRTYHFEFKLSSRWIVTSFGILFWGQWLIKLAKGLWVKVFV